MTTIDRLERYSPFTYADAYAFGVALLDGGRSIARFITLVLGLRRPPTRHAHVLGNRGSTWPVMIAHYVVAVALLCTPEGRRRSVFGRVPRVTLVVVVALVAGIQLGGWLT